MFYNVDNNDNFAPVTVDENGDIKERGKDHKLFWVLYFNAEKNTHEDEVFVLAPSKEDAISQAATLFLQLGARVQHSEDAQKYSVVKELPFLVRGWGARHF